MSARILVVEDDRTLRKTVVDALQLEGFQVTSAEDGRRGAELVYSRHHDLILLDVMLPGRSGLEILKALRDDGVHTPVLLMTVRGEEHDRVLGLELGADDYIPKPFGVRELVARVRAHLRRATRLDPTPPEPVAGFHLGEQRVDLEGYRLFDGDSEHTLSRREVGMLELLFRAGGKPVSRDTFLDELWGEAIVSHRTIDTHVLNLRHKIEADPHAPCHLETVHGVGYRLVGASPL